MDESGGEKNRNQGGLKKKLVGLRWRRLAGREKEGEACCQHVNY